MSGKNQLTKLAAFVLCMPVTATAHSNVTDPWDRPAEAQNQREGLLEVARTADTGNGSVGKRQDREDGIANVEPLARIDNRIDNRIENRIRNRVGRHFDLTATATSPFERANDEVREPEQRGTR